MAWITTRYGRPIMCLSTQMSVNVIVIVQYTIITGTEIHHVEERMTRSWNAHIYKTTRTNVCNVPYFSKWSRNYIYICWVNQNFWLPAHVVKLSYKMQPFCKTLAWILHFRLKVTFQHVSLRPTYLFTVSRKAIQSTHTTTAYCRIFHWSVGTNAFWL